MAEFISKIRTIEWIREAGGGFSRMVNQLLIPYEFEYVDIKSSNDMFDAIKTMIVRGAPAIGIAGAHGVALSAMELSDIQDFEEFKTKLYEKCDYINSSRPTAVNLAWAIEKQKEVIATAQNIQETVDKLIDNAIKLELEDIEINKKIGDFGAEVVPHGATILTHCNAGALATVGYGTALGVVRSAWAKGHDRFSCGRRR